MIEAPGRKSKYRRVQKTCNEKAGQSDKGNARNLRFARKVGSSFKSDVEDLWPWRTVCAKALSKKGTMLE